MTLTVGDKPAELNLDIYRGDTFSKDFRFKAAGSYIDLSGYTASASLQRSGAALVDFACEIVMPQSGDDVGRVRIELTPEQTAALVKRPKTRWDLQLISPGDEVTTYLKGVVFVDGQVNLDEP